MSSTPHMTPGALEPMKMLDDQQSSDDSSLSSENQNSKFNETYERREMQDCKNRNMDDEKKLTPIFGGVAESLVRADHEIKAASPLHMGVMDKPLSLRASEPGSQQAFQSLLPHLMCPITNQVFRKPCTLVADGWTYDKWALMTWFQLGYDVSPKTGEKLYGLTAFADNRILESLISKMRLVPNSPYSPDWLRQCARLQYENITTASLVEREKLRAGGLNSMSMSKSKRVMSHLSKQECIPMAELKIPPVNNEFSSPVAQGNSSVLVEEPSRPLKQLWAASSGSRSISFNRPKSSPMLRGWPFINSSLELMPIERFVSHRREKVLLEKLSNFPQKGTWTMEEPTNFWYIKLDKKWQGAEFRNWLVQETEATVGNLKKKAFHVLAEEWADKLGMPRSSIGWFTPPFHGDLKIPVHNSINNPSREFKKGETIRFSLEGFVVRDAPDCRYGQDGGNLPRHLPHQREDNGRSSYTTAMFSVNVKFIRDDVMPVPEAGDYYCNLTCYGVRDALASKVINLSKEGGLQPGELPSSRLSEKIQKMCQTDGVGSLVHCGNSWFCVLSKVWQNQRIKFMELAKEDFSDSEIYNKFCKRYPKSKRSKECSKQSENDFMKWTVKHEQIKLDLGELDTSKLDNVNTINFNVPYLQFALVGDKLMINAKVVFPDLDITGGDKTYHFTIATVTPVCLLDNPLSPQKFDEI